MINTETAYRRVRGLRAFYQNADYAALHDMSLPRGIASAAAQCAAHANAAHAAQAVADAYGSAPILDADSAAAWKRIAAGHRGMYRVCLDILKETAGAKLGRVS